MAVAEAPPATSGVTSTSFPASPAPPASPAAVLSLLCEHINPLGSERPRMIRMHAIAMCVPRQPLIPDDSWWSRWWRGRPFRGTRGPRRRSGWVWFLIWAFELFGYHVGRGRDDGVAHKITGGDIKSAKRFLTGKYVVIFKVRLDPVLTAKSLRRPEHSCSDGYVPTRLTLSSTSHAEQCTSKQRRDARAEIMRRNLEKTYFVRCFVESDQSGPGRIEARSIQRPRGWKPRKFK